MSGSSSSVPSPKNNPNPLDATTGAANANPNLIRSVETALAGLDRAEQLRDDGRYSQAMELYGEHIGALIGHLKSIDPEKRNNNGGSSSSSGSSGIDRAVLADRIRVALSDAEALKQNNNLRLSKNNGGSSRSQIRKASASVSPTSRISGAFSSMLGIGNKSRSYEEDDDDDNPRKDYDYAHAQAMKRNSSWKKNKKRNQITNPTETTNTPPDVSTSSFSTNPIRQPSSRRQSSPTAAAAANQQPHGEKSPDRKKRSNLDYATNDALVRTVKTELYVDKAQLTTKWDDVVGLVPAKRALQEAAILPMIRPDLYTGLRSPPKGVLLYGPPGTGKTMLVRAAAKESKCILFSCTSSALTSKWHGEGEKLLRTLFAVAIDAAPSMIFLDEIDALLSSRKGGGEEHEASRRFKTEFMVRMEGIVSGNNSNNSGDDGDDDDVSHRVLVLGCSNCPWDIDDAVMRRFQRRIYVPLPDKDARSFLLNKLLSKEKGKHSLSKKQIQSIVDKTDGFSCSDLSNIAQDAAFGPLRDLGGVSEVEHCNSGDIRRINNHDFEEALANTKRSVSNELLAKYQVWEDQQGAR